MARLLPLLYHFPATQAFSIYPRPDDALERLTDRPRDGFLRPRASNPAGLFSLGMPGLPNVLSSIPTPSAASPDSIALVVTVVTASETTSTVSAASLSKISKPPGQSPPSSLATSPLESLTAIDTACASSPAASATDSAPSVVTVTASPGRQSAGIPSVATTSASSPSAGASASGLSPSVITVTRAPAPATLSPSVANSAPPTAPSTVTVTEDNCASVTKAGTGSTLVAGSDPASNPTALTGSPMPTPGTNSPWATGVPSPFGISPPSFISPSGSGSFPGIGSPTVSFVPFTATPFLSARPGPLHPLVLPHQLRILRRARGPDPFLVQCLLLAYYSRKSFFTSGVSVRLGLCFPSCTN